MSVYRDRLSNGGNNAFAAHPCAEPKLFSISRVTKLLATVCHGNAIAGAWRDANSISQPNLAEYSDY